MSNIPTSAMPHAGTTSAMTETGTNSTGSAAIETPRHDWGDADGGRGRYDDASSPARHEQSLKARLSNHKVAVAVAAGAVTAAAIPFMLSARKKSSERRDYPRAGYVEGRERADAASYDYDIVTGERSGVPSEA